MKRKWLLLSGLFFAMFISPMASSGLLGNICSSNHSFFTGWGGGDRGYGWGHRGHRGGHDGDHRDGHRDGGHRDGGHGGSHHGGGHHGGHH